MAIEWAPILLAAVKPGAAELTKAAKQKLLPGELEQALSKALAEVVRWDDSLPPSQHLFYRCDDKQVRDFWGRVAASSLFLGELRKLIDREGAPDRAVLQELMEREAAALGLKLVKKTLPGWVGALVASYEEQTGAVLRFQAAKLGYVANLRRRVDDVKFVGIDVPGEEIEKQGQLERIFVLPEVQTEERYGSRWGMAEDLLELRTELAPMDTLTQRSGRLNRNLMNREPQVERLGADRIFSGQRQQRAVILGVPGAGKSTLVNYFALMVCQGQAERVGLEPGQDWLPVVIRLRDWALRSEKSLLDYCRWLAEEDLGAGKENFKLPSGFFEFWWERGQVLLLLDGLDEVANDGQRRDLVEKIESFVGDNQCNPLLITSRPVGYRRDFFGDREFVHYNLEEFDRARIDLFIDNWYESRVDSPEEARDRKDSLRTALERKGPLLQLARNPLLLTIITLIHRYQADLPRQRYKLYEKAVSTFLTTWDLGNKRQGKEFQFQSQLLNGDDDWLYVLKKVAYAIHQTDRGERVESGTLIAKDDLIEAVSGAIRSLRDCSPHDAKKEAKGFVEYIRARTGLLMEQGVNNYAFVHKTFQEYLTAEEIHGQMEAGDDEIIAATIREYLHDPHWREVLLLLVARLKGKRAAGAMREVLGAGSDYEQWLHRDLLFAGWCLTEDSEGLKQADRALVDEILQRLMELEVLGRRKVGGGAITELTQIFEGLAETKFQADALEILESRQEEIDRWRVFDIKVALGRSVDVISFLLNLLSDPDELVRSSAARTLGKIGNGSEQVVNGLSNLLSDPHKHVRSSAAGALGKIGKDSEPVVNALLNLLSDPDRLVRLAAAGALGEIGNDSEPVVNALLNLLSDSDEYVRSIAAESLAKIGHNSVLPNLIDRLKDISDDDIPAEAIDLLRQLVIAESSQQNTLPPDTPIYFKSITLENILCFKEKQTLELLSPQGTPAQWTVILGDNGVGKTTLLRCLAALTPATTNPYTPQLAQDHTSIFVQALTPNHNITAELTCGPLASPDRLAKITISHPNSSPPKGKGTSALPNLQCYGYGASRTIGSTSLAETLPTDRSRTLFFDTATLINAEEWLLQADYAARTTNEPALQDRLHLIKDTLQNLLPDVLDIRIAPATPTKPQASAEFQTHYGWISLAGLGLGYRTTIAWIVDLAARMCDRYPNHPNPLAEPAIVLVDEIDLHLHPRWQRTIMDFLSQRFPQTQFIVTAHSPLVVQAASKANIVLVRRIKDKDGVAIDNNPTIIENWRIDQVLTSVFELSSAHAAHIEPLLQRRRALLAKNTLTKKDQAELTDLETQIGPLPTAESPADIQAMDIIRRAAQILDKQQPAK